MTPEDQAWRERVIQASEKAVHDAQAELITIAEAVLRKHGTGLFQRAEAMRVAIILNEIQSDSFLLGIRVGVRMVMDILKEQHPKTKESEAS